MFVPIVAACAAGAAFNVAFDLIGNWLSGRKTTLGGLLFSAATGCIAGLIGLGAGKILAEALDAAKAYIDGLKIVRAVSGLTFQIGDHVTDAMVSRGWSPTLIQDTIINPIRTVPTRDTGHLPGGAGVLNDPATAFFRADGTYVVRNDITGDIVQISDRNDPTWITRLPPR
jgi:filamentous hemagglutinin